MNLSHRILCRETSAAGDTYRITHGHTLDDDKDDAGIGRVLFDLVVHLRPHAAGDRQREAIGDDVENLRSVASLFQKNGREAKDAAGELQAVGAVDNLPVHRVWADALRLHQVYARDAEREDWAATPLKEQPKLRSDTGVGEVDAAASRNVPLTASIVGVTIVILFENGLACPAGCQPAGSGSASQDAAARLAAARVLQTQRKLVRIVLCGEHEAL